ncbi:MAG: LpxI family protein [Nitrospinales bacterium]
MTENSEQCIGLIAGAGVIPLIIAQKATDNGHKVVSISLSTEISTELTPFVHKNYSIGVGQIHKILKTLRSENISQVIIAGKVEKEMVFKLQMFDLKTLNLLRKLKSRQDKAILEKGIELIENEGFRVIDQKKFLKELFPSKGILTSKQPPQNELDDIEYGFSIAKYMADKEIGQTIIVKNKTVIAVEGVEGTDQAIERGCLLGKDNCIAIKVSRTNQDFRYDCPGIGPRTIEYLAKGKASLLAIEADNIMLVEKEKVLKLANKAGIAIICV